MAKSKSGPALFDLLGEEEAAKTDQLKVPKWWESGGSEPPRPHREPEPAVPTMDASEPVAGPRERSGEGAAIIELDDDRIRISLTSVSAALAVFGALVVAFGAFELGRNTGTDAAFQAGVAAGRASYEAEVLSEIDVARSQPPATELVEDLLLQPAPATAEALDAEESAGGEQRRWIRGHTYIVVQEFARGYENDAAKAQAFLLEQGIATDPVALPGGSVQLITTQGYNRGEPTQRSMSDALLGKVHGLGKAYFQGGGGYRLEGYFKTLKGDSW